MADLRGPQASPDAVAVAENIFHLKGVNLTVLVHPGGAVRLLYLECEEGEYRLRVGNIADIDMPEDAIPKNEVTDGAGSLSLRAGQVRIMPAPEELTVRGLSNKSVLTLYYV